jgi:hypothetical protein
MTKSFELASTGASFKDMYLGGGGIFSGGPGKVPVGKSVSLQLPAYIYAWFNY